ncbi:hypothetical protein SUGI_0977190 [Cryptomeria japonica]|nr:hypothetical protein SUGI_0977190 [Cryptomeria japonica]
MHTLLVLFLGILYFAESLGFSRRSETVNVGALFAVNSAFGKMAKKAVELAVEDVNGNFSVLNGTKLVMTFMDSNCSTFLGTFAGTHYSSFVASNWNFLVCFLSLNENFHY